MSKQQQVNVAITLDDGSLAIMGFLTVGRGSVLPYGATWRSEGWWERPANDANLFHEISRGFATGPQPVRYRLVSADDIPADRTFRDALADDGKELTYNMPKAREMQRERIRRARVAKFAANDLAMMDAVVEGDQQKIEAAKARRQYLRDAPADPRIDAAQTVDELKAIELE